MKKLLAIGVLVVGCFRLVAGVPQTLTDAQVNKVVNAIYQVEGGNKTKHPYGILSVKTSNPRQVCYNTVKNTYSRWVKEGAKGDFLDYLADRYCPKVADPIGNKNWKKNIHKLVDKL